MTTAIGTPLRRVEGEQKVTGTATYAFEQPFAGALYGWPVQSRVAVGRVTSVETASAMAVPGVVVVLTVENAPRLGESQDPELLVLQSPDVAYRGQVIALVVATTQETAREVATTLDVTYDEQDRDVVLTTTHPTLYAPEKVNPAFATRHRDR